MVKVVDYFVSISTRSTICTEFDSAETINAGLKYKELFSDIRLLGILLEAEGCY